MTFFKNSKLANAILYIICLTGCITFLSCSDDSDGTNTPRYRADFFDIVISPDSIVTDIILDNGRKYAIENIGEIISHTSDTIVRCFGTLSIAPDSTNVTIFTLQQVICSAPNTQDEFKPGIYLKSPLSIVSIYKVQNYINTIVSAKVSGNYNHAFGFIKDSITTCNGKSTMHFTLLHWKHQNDTEGYSQNAHMSLPLRPSFYEPEEQFDSVEISVNTYDGVKKYKFAR